MGIQVTTGGSLFSPASTPPAGWAPKVKAPPSDWQLCCSAQRELAGLRRQVAALQVEVADRDAALAQRDGAIAALEHRLTHVAVDEVGAEMRFQVPVRQ